MAESGTYNGSCEYMLTNGLRHYLPVAICATALLSLAGCCTAVLVLTWARMYRTFNHRMILYLLIYTIFGALVYGMRIAGFIHPSRTGHAYAVFCSIAGFLNQYAGTAQLIIQTLVTFHIGCTVLLVEARCTRPLGHHYLGITTAFDTDSSSSKAKRYFRRLELVYALSPALLPLLFVWIPFTTGDYGQAGIWCWIRSTNDTCDLILSGIAEQYLMWYAPRLLLALVNTFTIVSTVSVISWRAYQFINNKETSSSYTDTLKQVLPILAYPVIFQILGWFALAHRITNLAFSRRTAALLVLHSIGTASRGLFAAAVFHVYFVVWRSQSKKRVRSETDLPPLRLNNEDSDRDSQPVNDCSEKTHLI